MMRIRIATCFKLLLVLILITICRDSTASTTIGNYRTEEWRMVEITLHSEFEYEDPFNSVTVDALFVGPKGIKMIRPAFWDGGDTWKIRFAPPVKGVWRMTTTSNKKDDQGLQSVKSRIICRTYRGEHEIFKHGFVKQSDNGRYFVYNDGTPFFYLGDTHWCFIHERFDTSNVRGISSQFQYTVNKRVEQGFTVYQSEAIQYPQSKGHSGLDEEPYCSFDNGFGADDLPGLKNLDRKFAYIANSGLLHANSQICWATDPVVYSSVYSKEYMYNLGRYWSARFGAYPVLWTVAQEVDKNLYGQLSDKDLEIWINMAKGLTENDCYHHPLSAHMEDIAYGTDANNSSWGELTFHTWWAIQWKNGMNSPAIIKTFWNNANVKPCILYESGYENLAVSAMGSLRQGFIAFQSGLFGYGYGANGIWNDLYAKNDMGTSYYMPEHYLHWYEGANLEGATLLSNLKAFYQSIRWWELEPRFDDESWAVFSGTSHFALSSIDNSLYLVYLWKDSSAPIGVLKRVKTNVPYIAKWYNPLDGEYHTVGEFISTDGNFTIPQKPSQDDWMFIFVEKGRG